MQRNQDGEPDPRTGGDRNVTIAGQPFVLRAQEVSGALRDVEPEPIASHYVVVGARRYPPKQVISVLTGLDRADFTTHQARRTLMRLGFPVGRRAGRIRTGTSGVLSLHPDSPAEDSERLADRLRPLAGQWVAIKDDDLLHAAPSPHALIAWLGRHGRRADSVFRVPEDDLAGTGLAPL